MLLWHILLYNKNWSWKSVFDGQSVFDGRWLVGSWVTT